MLRWLLKHIFSANSAPQAVDEHAVLENNAEQFMEALADVIEKELQDKGATFTSSYDGFTLRPKVNIKFYENLAYLCIFSNYPTAEKSSTGTSCTVDAEGKVIPPFRCEERVPKTETLNEYQNGLQLCLDQTLEKITTTLNLDRNDIVEKTRQRIREKQAEQEALEHRRNALGADLAPAKEVTLPESTISMIDDLIRRGYAAEDLREYERLGSEAQGEPETLLVRAHEAENTPSQDSAPSPGSKTFN